MNAKDLAGKLYDAYSKGVGGTAFNGVPLPTWDDFLTDPTKERQLQGWIAVAEEACRSAEECVCE